MAITAVNDIEVMAGEIGNAYHNLNNEGKMYTCAGAKFKLIGITTEGTLLEVVKVLCGLITIGNRWHANLPHTLRVMGFKPTKFDPDFCIRGAGVGYPIQDSVYSYEIFH